MVVHARKGEKGVCLTVLRVIKTPESLGGNTRSLVDIDNSPTGPSIIKVGTITKGTEGRSEGRNTGKGDPKMVPIIYGSIE